MPSKTKAPRKSGSARSTPNEKTSDLSGMTDTSQIVASLLGNNSSLNVSGRRSEGKRKSLPVMSDSQDTNVEDDIESEVTDVEERKEIQQHAKTNLDRRQHHKIPKEKVDSKTKNALINKLSPDELEVHYSQCIELFAKNKVNVKNAFKLQLIDFMKLMIDRKTDKSENLALMSCTLDASAKIYSCRVDNVYTNLLKFVKSYQSGKVKDGDKERNGSPTKGGGGSSDEENSDLENSSKKKKDKRKPKKTSRQRFVKDVEALNRKEVKMCYYRQNLPRNQLYFLESSVLDDGHRLAPNRPLFVKPNPDVETTSTSTVRVIKAEVDRDKFEEKVAGYKDLRNRIFIADDGPEDEANLAAENSFTFDPSIESIAEMKNFSDISDGLSETGSDNNDEAMEMDYDDCDMETSAIEDACIANDSDQAVPNSDRLSIPESNDSRPRVSFTPIAMTRMLRSSTSKHSDYTFFDDSKLAFMPSATHWKIKPSKSTLDTVGKAPGQKRKGRVVYLDFTSFDGIKASLELVQQDNNVSHRLSVKTTKDWFFKKTDLVFLPIIPNVRKQLLSFFKDPGLCILNLTKNAAEKPNQHCDVNESVLLNPLDFTTNEAGEFDDNDDRDDGGNYDPLEDWGEKMDANPSSESFNKQPNESTDLEKSSSLDTPTDDINADSKLVPLPTRVEKVAVKFAKAQKRIDIKKLKGTVWSLMDLEDTNSENKENEEVVDKKSSKRKEVNFSEVFKVLPGKMSREAAAELSYPLAFMAILHMANEKCLRLRGNQEHTDFTVSLDTPL